MIGEPIVSGGGQLGAIRGGLRAVCRQRAGIVRAVCGRWARVAGLAHAAKRAKLVARCSLFFFCLHSAKLGALYARDSAQCLGLPDLCEGRVGQASPHAPRLASKSAL